MGAGPDATARIIRENWARVCAQVHEACVAAGRKSQEVRIVGVSKYVGAELASQLAAAGCSILGENRPQSLWEKCDALAGYQLPEGVSVQWHLIGHLQRNKIRRTLPLLSMLHSLDSLRLAQAINQEATASGTKLPVLIEVNVTSDQTKTGLQVEGLEGLLAEVVPMPGLEVRGLMAMSSLSSDADLVRREFEQVRELRDHLQARFADEVQLSELSMGMSGDFRTAIAAGATLVRIGSRLWEGVMNP